MRKRNLENTLFSFLDVISCGFGAIVMLILIYKFEPNETTSESSDNYFELIEELDLLKSQNIVLTKTYNNLKQDNELLNSEITKQNKILKQNQEILLTAAKEQDDLLDSIEALNLVKDNLQSFSIKKKKKKIIRDKEVGGIPVDSNYVIFVVDTSGSMLTIWDKVSNKIENILNIHPDVKGFQILNDMGVPLISGYENKWIPDTPVWRKNSIKLFKMWVIASNSSPVEGIEKALKNYSEPNKSVSIYVVGDDYTGGDYDQTIDRITKINKKKFSTKIHGIGFLADDTTDRFSIIMRELTLRNNGTFLAIPK